MSLSDELYDDLVDQYRRAYAETGYRASRFKQALDRNGGLATAKRMLSPRTKNQRSGLDRLLEAGKPELTLEYLVLQPKYASLFTAAELAAAEERLVAFREDVAKLRSKADRLYPDELEAGRGYNEGAKKQVRVNRYERDSKAREACIAVHGLRCAACDLEFEERYGGRGRGFIHVHHLRPLAAVGRPDSVDPRTDLVPVCPNCHAMLHRGERLLSIDELRAIIDVAATQRRTPVA
jgi:5-methylcytosine-specific restriction protein A